MASLLSDLLSTSRLRWPRRIVGVALLAALVFVISRRGSRELSGAVQPKLSPTTAGDALTALVKPIAGKDNALRLVGDDAVRRLGLEFAAVTAAEAIEQLRLPGTLAFDPNRLIRVHPRFSGEAVAIRTVKDASGTLRNIQYGDQVEKGQLLAVVWSKDIGEKKSELLEARLQLENSRRILKRLESLPAGVVSERAIQDARRDVEADTIAAARAARTLRSWRVTDQEIAEICRELEAIKTDPLHPHPATERTWAEVEIRAAIDGMIIEKNFNVGDLVDPADDLFKIANVHELQVLVNIYEEDLHAVRRLQADERRWILDLRSGPSDHCVTGRFDLIGRIIDPAQRTGILMGRIDNSRECLAAGQFVTATIDLPAPNLLAVPDTALVESEKGTAAVLVAVTADRRQLESRTVRVVRRGDGVVFLDGAGQASSLTAGDIVVSKGARRLGYRPPVLAAARSK
jgi:cobalt-zinc-cadmium efflux system membrane fusion protein